MSNEKHFFDTKRKLVIEPDAPHLLFQIGEHYFQKKDPKTAAIYAIRTVNIEPRLVDYLALTGVYLIEAGQSQKSLQYLGKAICLKPQRVNINLDFGTALNKLFHFRESVKWFVRETINSPNNPIPYFNLGNSLIVSGDPKKAAVFYDKAIQFGLRTPAVLKTAALANLLTGNFRYGWELYEHRFQSQELEKSDQDRFLRAKKPKLTKNEKIDRARILVWGEQGLGDEIMFSSMLNDFYGECGKLLVQIDRRLLELYSRSFPTDIQFFDRKEQLAETLYDYHIPIGSLGRFVRTDIESFKKQSEKFLSVDSDRFKHAELLINKKPEELIIGLSWSSNNPDTGSARSIPLIQLITALKSPRIRFISLQYGEVSEQIEMVRSLSDGNIEFYPEIDYTHDLDMVSALIECCDQVVSIGNTIAHLAGALGKFVTVIVPEIGSLTKDGDVIPGWRWIANDDACLWYPRSRLLRVRFPVDPHKLQSLRKQIIDESYY